MECEYGYNDCLNNDKKCHLCIDAYHYLAPKQKKETIKYAKATKRKGTQFEADNHNLNAEILSGVSSRLTPNSGAGSVKGDEEIQGIITVMEELKERESYNSKGKQTFTMEKAWFDKLDKEGSEAKKEFWYLKFHFANDPSFYVAMDYNMAMGMVYTMSEDRKAKLQAFKEKDAAIRARQQKELEIEELKQKIKELQK